MAVILYTREALSFWGCLLLTILLLCNVGMIRGEVNIDHTWSKSTDLVVPNEPLIDDFNYDYSPELILTDIEGGIRVYNAESGNLLWKKHFKHVKFTPPAGGNFLGTFRRNIAVGGSNGFVYIFDGLSGKEILRFDVGTHIIYQLTPVPLGSLEYNDIKDGLVVIDITGRVHLYEIVNTDFSPRAVEQWSILTGSNASAPASVGYVTGSPFADVVFGTNSGDIWVVNVTYREGRSPLKFTNLSRLPPREMILPVNVIDDEKEELVFCDDAGNLNALKYHNGSLTFLWREVPIYGSSITPPIDVDLNLDGNKEIIVATNQTLNCYLGSLGENCWAKPYNVLSNIVSGPGHFTTEENKSMLFLIDERQMAHFINVADGSAFSVQKLKKNHFMRSPLLVDADGDSHLDIIGLSDGGRQIVSLATDIGVAQNGFFWVCRGGNPYFSSVREGLYCRERQKVYEQATDFLIEKVERAVTSYERKEWDAAVESAREALEVNPLHERARKIYHHAWIRDNIVILILGSVFLIAIVGFLAFIIIRYFRRRSLVRRALQLIAQDKSRDAIPLLRQLLRAEPTDKHIATIMAKELIKIADFSPENIHVFELAFISNNQDKHILQALATVYKNAARRDQKALDIYIRAYEYVQKDPQFAFTIASIYREMGDLEKTAHFLRDAIRQGMETHNIFEMLADVYLELGFTEPKAIRIFENVYDKYKSKPEFLKALCVAYKKGKRVDKSARNVYERVLTHDPTFLPALIQMAKIFIQENNLKEAEKAAESILSLQPDNSEGFLLLSQCYLLSERRDVTAIQTFEQTLHYYPDNEEILRELSHRYWKEGRLDKEARDIYLRAYKHHKNDPDILFAMAKSQENVEHPELVTDVIERLIKMRLALPEHYQVLAKAYKKLYVTEPKAIEVYRRVLSLEGEDFSFLELLADAYLEQDCVNEVSIAVYEKVVRHNPKLIKIARQLAKSYIENRLYEQCLTFTSSMLKMYPGEKQLLHYKAQASLLHNEIDQAIRQYEEILKTNPQDALAHLNLALAFARKGRTDDDAANQYERALAEHPDNFELLRIRARVYAERHHFEKTIDDLKSALNKEPRFISKIISDCRDIVRKYPNADPLRWFLLELLMKEGRLRESLKELDIIFEHEPEKIDQILKAYKHILSKDPDNVMGHLKRGMMLKVKGDFEKALQEMEKAYDLKPNDADVQTEIAELYELILRETENNEIRFKLGKVSYVMGDYDRAIGCFQKSSQDFRWEGDSLKMLGRCFVAKGMLDLALQEFKKLVVDDELKELLYDLAQRYEMKKDLVGAKTVYKHLFAADIDYKDVRQKFEMFAGSTSDPLVFEKTTILNTLSEKAKRRYELLEEVGRGAMGIVYRARDNELEEIVALKILPDNLSNNPDALARFKQEARSARRLSHPNIVRIHDIGEELGRKYISMEFVEGIDLKHMIKKRDFAWETAIRLGYQITDALAYAHSIGIIHRDIKPANIMITKEGLVKITDFGIAKVMESTEVTLAGSVLGTPLYMSPEQVQGIPVDHRADIYSLGVLLYEIIRGRPPFFEGDLAYQHLHVQPEILTEIPEDISNVIMRCLRKKREERWKDTLALRAEFERIALNHKMDLSPSL